METIGIICEYNPFHNGHLFHIEKIKELYPDSLIILILNGYFLERGEISTLTKEEKTKIALQNKIDIVLELPFIYGTQAADTFAEAAISILENMHASKLIFGSESADQHMLTKIAVTQLDQDYNELVKKYLDEGINYPTALAKALNINFDFKPNDLLGISYTKAIIKNNFDITPLPIKRANDFHDKTSNDSIVSASNIREKLLNKEDISKYLPKEIIPNIIKPNNEKLFELLKYKINTDHDLSKYLDVDEGIEYRLKEFINKSNSLSEYIFNIKTKRYTYNKINRMLIHILIGLLKDDNHQKIEYIKILGFNQKGQNYLNSIKDTLTIPTNPNKESITYKYELKASIIYDLINNTNTYAFEQKNKPIIFD